MKRILFFCLVCCGFTAVQAQSWPSALSEAKAGTRWWWLGSAVDRSNLEWNLSEYAKTGIGAVEITPLYGVQGNEKNELDFLSPAWMRALNDVQAIAKEQHIEVDMNCGTGWPFGGPLVPIEEAACKALFIDTLIHAKQVDVSTLKLVVPEKERKFAKWQCTEVFPTDKADEWRVIAVYASRTRQKVKRAAPGGEGWVIDHFDRQAVKHYLDRFEKAFAQSGVAYPHTFFNDSYEVYQANWTPSLFDEFQKRRGYDLRRHLPELLDGTDGNQVLSDYRETLSDLLYENFTLQWVAWAHSHGVQVRNQAHGSPANLLDLYAAVDIPEIEGFGLSEFGINGLRTDPGKTKKNFSDVSMLKYAPSAAHVMGKPFTSSETFTWLTEHFRTSLSQLKPDLDLMFCAGVNHIFFHGTCYSPKDDPWPGWKFYASIDMSPTNSIWRDAPYFMQYVERCQSFLQWGQPDNDFLVYLPVRDMWKKQTDKLMMQFSIHQMGKLAPEFIKTILSIDNAGYDCDYISDRLLSKVTLKNDINRLVTEKGTCYKAIIIPSGTTITPELKQTLDRLSPLVIYGESAEDMARFAKSETMKKNYGLKAIRRQNDTGYHYFIANLTPDDIEADVPLAVAFETGCFFNPLNGEISQVEKTADNKIHLSLRSGESIILQTYNKCPQNFAAVSKSSAPAETKSYPLNGQWTLSFTEEEPKVAKAFTLAAPQTWETLDDDNTKVTMGTGVYTTHIKLNKKDIKQAKRWRIDLGDVRESARVYINGEFIGCAWSVPYVLDCKNTLKAGDNVIRIEVTNLPANRIADYDRKGIKWRKMEEINVVDINYKRTTYADWTPVPSGLNSEVTLISE